MSRLHVARLAVLLFFSACSWLCAEPRVKVDSERRSMEPERPPYPWPNNLNVRPGEPGCWRPPRDLFSPIEARLAVLAPFAASLDPDDRRFGAIPEDVHIDGFVKVSLRMPRKDGAGIVNTPCEVSIVQLGPRKEKSDEVSDHAIKTFLLLTSGGRLLFRKDLGDTGSGAFAEHYTLSRVVTRFEKDPFVLLFGNVGANTRDFYYELYRVRAGGLEQVWWSDDWTDGHTGSLQQWFSHSNFDFSALRSGRANEFSVYTTSGCRRWMEPGDEKDLKPKYTKRLYRWDPVLETFVKVAVCLRPVTSGMERLRLRRRKRAHGCD